MSSGPDPVNRPGTVPANPANPLQNPPSAPGHSSPEPMPAAPNDLPGSPESAPSSDFETDTEHPLGPHNKVRGV
jgi:hypothetical protein